jgi:hypothetical protein
MNSKKLRLHGIIILAFLLAEYIFGMLTNLYIHFPEGNTSGQQWEYAGGQGLVIAHIILGTLLVLTAISLLTMAIKAKDRIWKLVASVGFGAILLASAFGSEFVSKQNESSSFWMSLFFIVAVAAYGWGLYTTKDLAKK